MERALFLPPGESLPGQGFDRIYLGAEFCPWRLPCPDDLAKTIERLRHRKLRLTLVTPVLSEVFLAPFATFLGAMVPTMEPGDELQINDWGTLELLPELPPGVSLGVGRALSGQKRGLFFRDGLSPAALDALQRQAFDSASMRSLLAQHGIARVELDNLLQGLPPLPAGLRGSVHMPWLMLASSRNCPFVPSGDEGCARGQCGEVMVLTSERFEERIYQAGNTQFLRNEHLPENLPLLGIDRVVEHRILPV